MRRACVAGWPVAHSLSPALHGWWLKKYRIEGSYDAREATAQQLPALLEQLKQEAYAGCNLTLPHKELVLSLLQSMDEEARRIGAANTLILKDGAWHGLNTDAFGFAENLRRKAPGLAKQNALLLGAGGAARAVAAALLRMGFGRIAVCNRTRAKADALATQFGERVHSLSWEEKDTQLSRADLLVNATSLGMHGQGELALDLAGLPAHAVVADIVYKPLETPLLRQARERGLKCVDGLGMLIWQAVPAFEAWFGVRPEVTAELEQFMLERAL